MKCFVHVLLFVFIACCLQWAQAEIQEHDVRIATPNPEVILAGTLLVPEVAVGKTVVLMITGSGDHPRDAVISGTPMFRHIAEDLAAAGFASLRLDDRGTDESTGPTSKESTTADRVVDMQAALSWLRVNPLVSFSSIGLMGHSEGAGIALRLAAVDPVPDFAILVGAPVRPGAEVWIEQQLAGFRQHAGLTDDSVLEDVRESLKESVRLSVEGAMAADMTQNTIELFALGGIDVTSQEGRPLLEGFVSRMTDNWMRHFLADDPGAVLGDVNIPVLAIYGSHDRLTSPEQNAAVLLDRLMRAGNHDVTVRILPEQDHFFLRLPGEQVGVHRFGEMVLAPELLDSMRNWLQALTP